MNTARHCQICGQIPAPFGFRLAGLRRDLPAGKRGYLWVCHECRPDAEDRKAAAESKRRLGT